MLVEGFHPARQHGRVVSRARQFATGGGQTRFQVRLEQGAPDGFVEGRGVGEVEESAVLAVADQIQRARGAAGNDCGAGGPGFEDDQPERFGNRRQQDTLSGLKQADQSWIARRQPASQDHAILHGELFDFEAQRFAIDLVSAGTRQHEHGIRMPPKNFRRLLDQPKLVFHRIEAAGGQQQPSAANCRERFAGRFPMVFPIQAGQDAVRMQQDAFGRMLFLEQGRLFSMECLRSIVLRHLPTN